MRGAKAHTVIKAEAELSGQIFPWRECQRHQDTGMGDAHRQSTHYAVAKMCQSLMELLRACHHRQDYAYVLH